MLAFVSELDLSNVLISAKIFACEFGTELSWSFSAEFSTVSDCSAVYARALSKFGYCSCICLATLVIVINRLLLCLGLSLML